MRAFLGGRIRRVAFAAGAVLAVSAGLAYASIPEADGTFHACVNNGTGAVRLIDPSASGSLGHCLGNENQVSWNKKGQNGAKGAPGAQGDKGATGAAGPQGPRGAAGPAGGARGPQGDAGPTGPRGDTGATGAQGPKGDTGATGASGATGATGPEGDTGAQGPARTAVTVLASVISSGCDSVIGGGAAVVVHPAPGRCDVGFSRSVSTCTSMVQSTNDPNPWIMAVTTLASPTPGEDIGYPFEAHSPTTVVVTGYAGSPPSSVPLSSFGAFKLLVFC